MIILAVEFTESGLTHLEEHNLGLRLRDMLLERFAPSVKYPEFSVMEKGKPYIKSSDVTYSITHTDGCAGCALSVPGADTYDLPHLPNLVTKGGIYLWYDSLELPCEIGLDIESIDRERTQTRLSAIASRYFTEDELRILEESDDKYREFYKIWSTKESMVKCTGEGLSGVSFADTEAANNMGFSVKHFFLKCGEHEYSGAICRNDCLLPE